MVFLLALAGISFIIPKKIFFGYYSVLGILFIIISAVLVTCFVRNVKEKVIVAKGQKASLLGLIFMIIGLVAMDACTIGAPICTASLASGIVAMFLPGVALGFFDQYSVYIISFSLLVQASALYFMNCFKKVTVIDKK
jgi:hydrogenase-4 membrane subunit HyfE